MTLGAIILAAGKGTRMHSDQPKVLHPIGGKPLLAHVLSAARQASCQETPIVVCGHKAEQVRTAFADSAITWVLQKEQLGTGHAVMQTLPHLCNETTYLILVGDAPLIQAQTLQALAQASQPSGIAVLTVHMDNPTGYGRMIRCKENPDELIGIVEEKDANPQQKAITEINSGCFAVRGDLLKKLLPRISNQNQQGEYYLTDIVSLAAQQGHAVSALCITDSTQITGCNSKKDLAAIERLYQQQQADQLLTQGVTLMDPSRIDIRGTLTCGRDVTIDVNSIFIGEVVLEDGVHIGPNCLIQNSRIGQNSTIYANSVIEQATVGQEAAIGPFARIRPNTTLARQTKVGNFVELKNATINAQSKINHLSYVGDATVGTNVNIGAGVITCNYDGANKHTTTIEDDVFVGSNSAIVAPVTLASGSTIGAGSTISKSVPKDSLAIARTKQRHLTDWQRPQKKPKS